MYRDILRILLVHRNSRFIEGLTVLTETIVIWLLIKTIWQVTKKDPWKLGIENLLKQAPKARNTEKWNRTNKGMTSFHWLCLEGFSKIAKLFLDNTVDMDIDLNLKDNTFLWTGFHFACYYGKTSIVDMILTNSKSLNIDLTASDELGKDFSISGWNIDKRNCLFPFISYVFLNNGMIWQKHNVLF